MQRVHEDRRSRLVGAVMGREVQIHGANQVGWAGELVLDVPREIPEIDRPELAIGDHRAHRQGVFSRVGFFWLKAGAQRIGCTPPPGSGRSITFAAAETTRTSRPATGMGSPGFATMWPDDPRASAYAVSSAAWLAVALDALAVIHERADRKDRGDVRHAADMIHVVVRRDQVVDPRDAGVACRGRNPERIASVGTRPSCIDEHRLSRRRDEQRRLSALHVDEVDAQDARITSRGRGELRGAA